MAQTGLWLREVEIQVDYPGQVGTGEPMTVYGLNTGLRILNGVSATVDSANSANNNGPLLGGIAVGGADIAGAPTVAVYVYLNAERTLFDQVRLRKPNVAATTLTIPVTNGSVTAAFAEQPLVAPYGVRVASTSNAASAGTINVDLYLWGNEHGSSRG